ASAAVSFGRYFCTLLQTCSSERRRTRTNTTTWTIPEAPSYVLLFIPALSRAPSIPPSDVLKGKAENTGDYNDV
ncbi:unnamed protein product, partial [Closterium sp. NIES-54]